MLESKNLIVGPLSESVDMVAFKKLLNNGEIDIDPLIQALKQEISEKVELNFNEDN